MIDSNTNISDILGMSNQPDNRDKTIIRTSIIGIIANAFLAGFKAAVGILSNSIAITLDAVNNLSDAGSSLVTIIGTKLAGKQPDKKHPWGYGRIEYLSAMIIGIIVMYAGITSLRESVDKIIHPEVPSYSTVSLIIVGAAVLVKIMLGLFVQSTGKKVNSASLVNSGKDALMDSIISAATLVSAFIFILTGFSPEAWLGAVISLMIIKAGIEMLAETISAILGQRVEAETVKTVRQSIMSFPEVHGVYDIIFHDYGPDRLNCSAHIEIDDTMTADKIDKLERDITAKVFLEQNIIITALSVYSV
ncbi:MAG: cation transporter, partial [Spirochaetales bacterium]|nr:cation transporter [Spirochaetales bacterium]